MRTLIIILGVIAFAVGGVVVSTFITMFLWNVLANFFGFKEINFWIALVIVIIWTMIGSTFVKNKK